MTKIVNTKIMWAMLLVASTLMAICLVVFLVARQHCEAVIRQGVIANGGTKGVRLVLADVKVFHYPGKWLVLGFRDTENLLQVHGNASYIYANWSLVDWDIFLTHEYVVRYGNEEGVSE